METLIKPLPEILKIDIVVEDIEEEQQDGKRKRVQKENPLVFDGALKTKEFWDSIYPPNVPECKQLPGTNFPNWYYSWSYCTTCKNILTQCKHNPYSSYGEIGKARIAANSQHFAKLVAERGQVSKPQEVTTEVVDEVTGEITTVTKTVVLEGRATRGSFKQKISDDVRQDIRDKYQAGGTINGLSDEYNIRASVIREYLAKEGILRKQGKIKSISNNEPKVAKEPKVKFVIQPVVAVKKTLIVSIPSKPVTKPVQVANHFGRGRVRTTNIVTPEHVAKASKMLANGEGNGMVAIAKSMNLNANELSVALKAAGIVITKGRKKAI